MITQNYLSKEISEFSNSKNTNIGKRKSHYKKGIETLEYEKYTNSVPRDMDRFPFLLEVSNC